MGRRSGIAWLAAAGLLLVAGSDAGASSLITFDDINATSEIPVSGAGGLSFQNLFLTNLAWQGGNPDAGYVTGTVSGSNAVWAGADDGSPGTATATITGPAPFTLQSASFTAAWNDNLRLQVNGYRDGQLVAARTLSINPSGPTAVDLNFQDVDKVMLGSAGGTLDPATGSRGPQFVIDNLRVEVPGQTTPTPVPEPTTLALAALVAGWCLRRRGRPAGTRSV